MTDDWSRDMDRRLEQMRDNPEGYIAAARAEHAPPTPIREYLAWALLVLSMHVTPERLRDAYQDRLTDAWLRAYRPPRPLKPAPNHVIPKEDHQ